MLDSVGAHMLNSVGELLRDDLGGGAQGTQCTHRAVTSR
jgi:hypothetical protein